MTEQDKLRLWNECAPLSLKILFDSHTKAFAGLDDKIRIAVESRLRAASIYDPDVEHAFLDIVAHQYDEAVHFEVVLHHAITRVFG